MAYGLLTLYKNVSGHEKGTTPKRPNNHSKKKLDREKNQKVDRIVEDKKNWLYFALTPTLHG